MMDEDEQSLLAMLPPPRPALFLDDKLAILI
jgi:hypothetical protein